MTLRYFTEKLHSERDEFIVPCPGIEKLMQKLDDDLRAACEHRDTAKLTEDQKVAIAIKCGVPWRCEASPSDGGYKLTLTTNPCAVVFADGKWQAFHK